MMWRVFRSMGQLLWQLSYTPSIIKNSLQHRANAWFPQYFTPVCRSGDFTCYHSNGLMKLADILPAKVMDGLDYLGDNKSKVLGGMLIGASALTVYWGIRKYRSKKPPQALQLHPRTKQRAQSL